MDFDWAKIWKLKIEHRLKLLLWKILVGALPVRGTMGVRLWMVSLVRHCVVPSVE